MNKGVFKFMDFMFNIFPVFFTIVFIFVFGTIIFTVFSNLKQWNKNNNSPVLTVDSKIVSKRQHISRRAHNHNNNMHHTSHSTYYVTFEFESGDRLEINVPYNEYGLLVEGDVGKLTFQGTRFHKFERKR